MRTLSLFVALLCSLQITAQSNVCNLSKMSESDRNAYLITKAKEVIMNFGPRFYREYGEPEISGREVYEIKGNDIYRRSTREKYVGMGYYTVTFRYDMEKEIFEWDYAAIVEIWDDGEPKTVSFGEGYGTYFYEESYKERIGRGLRKSEIFDYNDKQLEERMEERQRTRELLGL